MSKAAGSTHLHLRPFLHAAMIAARAPALSSTCSQGQGRKRFLHIHLRVEKSFPGDAGALGRTVHLTGHPCTLGLALAYLKGEERVTFSLGKSLRVSTLTQRIWLAPCCGTPYTGTFPVSLELRNPCLSYVPWEPLAVGVGGEGRYGRGIKQVPGQRSSPSAYLESQE